MSQNQPKEKRELVLPSVRKIVEESFSKSIKSIVENMKSTRAGQAGATPQSRPTPRPVPRSQLARR